MADTAFAATTTPIELDGELTIYRAQQLKQPLLDLLAGAQGDVTISLAQVSEIDSAGVQLLMAAKRQAIAEGRALSLIEHSPAVLEAFALLDLAAWFGDPIVELEQR